MSTILDPGFATPVVSGATATGTAASAIFSVQPRGDGGDRTVTFRPNANGTVTTLTANLESSDDGGATWSVYPGGTGLTLSGLAQAQVLHLVAGLSFRLNLQTLTLGTATSLNINAAVS